MKKTVPVFYAVDDKYVPYLCVSFDSLIDHTCAENDYEIYILTTALNEESRAYIKKRETKNVHVHFVDVNERLKDIDNALSLRDYYSLATYYRVFIAGLFPQYDKVLYIDSDTVLLEDAAKLYDVDLTGALVGAVPDGAVAVVPEFRAYTKEVLGIPAEEYFNAGVLVMNLKEFRAVDFYAKFRDLLCKYKFTVAQDQDYLNVLCKGKVVFVDEGWNRMPIFGEGLPAPKLVHYNLTMKPWRYKDILYKEYFWTYAEKSEFFAVIKDALDSFTPEMAAGDAECEKNLRALALKEAESEENYLKKYGDA